MSQNFSLICMAGKRKFSSTKLDGMKESCECDTEAADKTPYAISYIDFFKKNGKLHKHDMNHEQEFKEERNFDLL